MKTGKRCLSRLLWVSTLWMGVVVLSNSWASEPVRIGVTVSETGPFSTEVGPFRRLLSSWARDVNARGGIQVGAERRPLRLYIYDDRSEEATARRRVERLIVKDRVHLLLGPYSSPLTFAASTASEAHGVPLVAICANSPKVYNRGYRWIVGILDEAARYTHRYWDMLRSEGQAKSVAFVVEDTLHPQGVFEGAQILAREAGLQVQGHRVAPLDTRDFSSIILWLKEEDPDVVFVSANIPFAVQFVAQARELGLHPREFHVIHHGGVFRKALGPAAEWVTGQSYWAPGMKGGDPERFLRILRYARIPLEDYPWAPAYMMAFQVVEAALKRAASVEPAVLMKTLKALKVETLGGLVRFRSNGVGTINTYPSQIQNGRYRIIWPPEVATGLHVYPRPSP